MCVCVCVFEITLFCIQKQQSHCKEYIYENLVCARAIKMKIMLMKYLLKFVVNILYTHVQKRLRTHTHARICTSPHTTVTLLLPLVLLSQQQHSVNPI